MDVDSKSEHKQVAVLLTVTGPATRKVYQTFTWTDARKIGPVLEKFEEFCQPRENVPFERYKFNVREQEPVSHSKNICQCYARWQTDVSLIL